MQSEIKTGKNQYLFLHRQKTTNIPVRNKWILSSERYDLELAAFYMFHWEQLIQTLLYPRINKLAFIHLRSS